MRSSHLSVTRSANPGRRPRAASRFWPWPWAGLLLALALSLAGAGKIPLAQAARAGDYRKQIYMVVTKAGSAERTICVGDKLEVSTAVLTVIDVIGDPNAEKQFARLYGVQLQAAVTDPGVGAISPAASMTSLDSDPVGVAQFTFTAKKAGTTTVKVDGKIINKQAFGVALSSDTVTGEMPLTVEKCEYRIDATGVWYIKGLIKPIAEITDAALAPDADGAGKYHGNADVKWFSTYPVLPRCHVIEHGPAPSRAKITGETLPGDVMEVNVVFEQTQSLTSTMVCPERSVEMPGSVLLQPESLCLWFRTTGGTVTRHPKLGGSETSSELATVTLIPVSGN